GWGDYFHPIACCFEEDITFKKNMLYLSSLVRSIGDRLSGKLNQNILQTSMWIKRVSTNNKARDGAKANQVRVLKICSMVLHPRNISVFGEHVRVEDGKGDQVIFNFKEFISILKQCVSISYKDMVSNMCERLKHELNSEKMNGTISFEVNWLLENSFGSFVSDLDKKYISFCNHNFIEYFLRQECDCNSVSDIISVLPVKPYAVLYQSGMNPNEMSLGFIWKGLKQWIQPGQHIYISQVLQSIQDYTNSHSDSMEKFYLKMKKYGQVQKVL
ncbi:MAG: hypothetical protein OXI23_01605, partial [Gemmatimonadota bacterium]|nr:hypothetical protein [Gemmatimonadota bacterium]